MDKRHVELIKHMVGKTVTNVVVDDNEEEPKVVMYFNVGKPVEIGVTMDTLNAYAVIRKDLPGKESPHPKGIGRGPVGWVQVTRTQWLLCVEHYDLVPLRRVSGMTLYKENGSVRGPALGKRFGDQYWVRRYCLDLMGVM